MDALLTKSRTVLDSLNGIGSNVSQKEKPSPTDFLNFLPWACRQLSIDVILEISRVVQTEYVNRMDFKVKSKPKHMRKGFVSESAKAFTSSSLSAVKVASLPSGLEYKAVRIVATYSGTNLVHIKIHKTKHLNRGILAIINSIIRFYPYLYGFAINSGADKYTIHELSKFLPISNITEISLDDTYIKKGNHDMILESAKQLKVLSLARCRLGDNVVEKVVSKLEYPLPSSETLSVLNLSTNGLTDVGAKFIAKMLRTNRHLRYLNIAGNMITDHGIEAMLNVLNKFPLTVEETLMIRKRHLNYLKRKQELIDENLIKVREAEMEKNRLKKEKKANNKISSKETLKSSSTNLIPETVLYDKAVAMTELEYGPFDDPFGKDTTSEDGLLYSNGNNTLAYLNFAYNNSSWCSLKILLKVLNYQKELTRNPRGLINVCLEGNPMPVDYAALFKIESLLEAGFAKDKEVTLSLKKKR